MKNIAEIRAGISNFFHRGKNAHDLKIARAAGTAFARLSLKAGKEGDQLGTQLFGDAAVKATEDVIRLTGK